MLQYLVILGHKVSMYDFWNIISVLAMALYILFHLNSYCLISHNASRQPSAKRKILVGLCEMIVMIVISIVLFRILNLAFGRWFTKGNANYFGSITGWSISITILTLVLKGNPLLVLDLFAPALPIQLFFAKLACFCFGCCNGFYLPGSFYYNQSTNRYEFPVQLVELAVAIVLFIFMKWYYNKRRTPGLVFPFYLCLYSFFRFITELFRDDYSNVIGPLDAYQLISIIYLLIGGFLFYLLCIYNSKENHK